MCLPVSLALPSLTLHSTSTQVSSVSPQSPPNVFMISVSAIRRIQLVRAPSEWNLQVGVCTVAYSQYKGECHLVDFTRDPSSKSPIVCNYHDFSWPSFTRTWFIFIPCLRRSKCNNIAASTTCKFAKSPPGRRRVGGGEVSGCTMMSEQPLYNLYARLHTG